ncbi:MAG: tyrosine--tRNA ligase, partial [Planctomycetota bacterium]
DIAELVNPDKTHPKQAKVGLGKTIVAQFHGQDAAESAAAEFDKVFARGQLPDDIAEVEIAPQPIAASKLLLACRLVSTGGEAKRMIKQSAASIDGEKLSDPNAEITPKDGSVIRVGKRKFARVKICD